MSKTENWWNYFDEDPYEVIGRQYLGLFDETITVRLSRINWAYLDWLKSELKGDIPRFIKDVEKLSRPEHGNRDDAFAGGVRSVFLRYERDGRPRPPWCSPADPNFFVDLEELEIEK